LIVIKILSSIKHIITVYFYYKVVRTTYEYVMDILKVYIITVFIINIIFIGIHIIKIWIKICFIIPTASKIDNRALYLNLQQYTLGRVGRYYIVCGTIPCNDLLSITSGQSAKLKKLKGVAYSWHCPNLMVIITLYV